MVDSCYPQVIGSGCIAHEISMYISWDTFIGPTSGLTILRDIFIGVTGLNRPDWPAQTEHTNPDRAMVRSRKRSRGPRVKTDARVCLIARCISYTAVRSGFAVISGDHSGFVSIFPRPSTSVAFWYFAGLRWPSGFRFVVPEMHVTSIRNEVSFQWPASSRWHFMLKICIFFSSPETH